MKQLLIGAAPLPADRLVGSVVALSLCLVLTRGDAGARERRAVAVAASIGGAAVVVPVALALSASTT